MRKIKTEFILIGSGCSTLLAANRLALLGKEFIIVNPKKEFSIGDLRPRHGMGLWNLCYYTKSTLPEVYDLTRNRLKDVFPVSEEHTGLSRIDAWSILSRTPVHRLKTDDLEREFFKMERWPFTFGQFRLVGADQVHAIGSRMGMDFSAVAEIDGAVQRSYALNWDAVGIGSHLIPYAQRKFKDLIFLDVDIFGHQGKRLLIETAEDEEVYLESSSGVYIFLDGSMMKDLKGLLSQCEEGWIRSLKKRYRERSFAWFEREPTQKTFDVPPVWMELGSTHYFWDQNKVHASWTTRSGPDSMDRIVDECLRMFDLADKSARFTREEREFWFEWEWRNPSWRKTGEDLHWATSFEGDLPSVLETVWTMPNS